MSNLEASLASKYHRAAVKAGICAGLLLALVGVSQAQSMIATATSPDDQSLSWHGITLYGIIDIGLQYDTHSAPFSDYYPAGSGDVVQKNSNNAVFGVTPSNLSQSRVGLQGKEPLNFMDWSGVFKVETFFNPQSGNISDGLKSLVQNNGKALVDQNVGIDSSVAGQPFQQAFAGLSSPTFGTVTFGRQNTIYADAIAKYDPEGASQAFSVIGLSGTPAGGGDTEDRRLDDSLKYTIKHGPVHFGAMYKFQNSTGSTYATSGSGEAFTVIQAQLGADYAGFSVDAYFLNARDAVAASSLSAAQFKELPTLGYSSDNSLAGTVSNNKTYSVLALYNMSKLLNRDYAPTLYAAWEHIKYMTPSIYLQPGFNMIGGYVLAFVNNTAYLKGDKVLDVYWGGVKYPFAKDFDLTLAYYGYKQTSYATGKDAGCSAASVSAACSGNLNAASIAGDYRFTKRFDGYAGIMWSNVTGGLGNGYLNTTNVASTIGVRFSF